MLPETHLSILQLLAELTLADREMVTAWCAKPSPVRGRYAFSAEGVKKALRTLEQKGYLLRPRYVSRDAFTRHRNPSRREVHMLSSEGYRAVNDPRLRRRVARVAKIRGRSESGLYHDLMVARFHLALKLLSRDHPGQAELVRFRTGDSTTLDQTFQSERTGEPIRVRIRPDAIFRLKRDDREFVYFLEADRGTERQVSGDGTHTDISRKVRRYAQAKHNDLVPMQWAKVKSFRVLWLTELRSDLPDRSNAVHLRPSKRDRSLLSTCRQYGGELGQTTNLFVLLSESDIRFNEPGWLLGDVAYTSRDAAFATQIPLIPKRRAHESAA